MVRTTSIDADYDATVRLVNKTVADFRRRYNVRFADLEDMGAEADAAFVEAWHSYDPEVGALSTWVRCCVWHRLKTWARRAAIQRRIEGTRLPDGFVTRANFDLETFLAGLDEDARIVVALALEVPVEVRAFLEGRAAQTRPAVVRGAVRRCLESVGWSAPRLEKAFAEIKEAIRGR